MLSRDLKLYFLLICLPAVVLTAVGIAFLVRQSVASRAHETEVRAARAEHIAADVQDVVQESAGTPSPEPFLQLEAGPDRRHPAGAFEWAPRGKLVWRRGVPDAVAAELSAKAFLRDWTDGSPGSVKKPPKRGHYTCVADGEAVWVFWARGALNDGHVHGVVFTEDPTESGLVTATVWPTALVLVVLLACVLVAGAWLMARAAAKARRDDETKTSFVSNVSHELNTPLAGIGIWIDLLRNGRLETEEKRCHAYDVIAGENARMARLVRNLLDFTRLEAGRTVFHLASVDLRALAAETADVAQGDFPEQGIRLLAGGPCRAWADADAVRQILVNLLGNAAKYAAAGGPVEISAEADGDVVRLSVADRGPGLSPEARARVFDRFYRADDALDSKTGGLGLGLSISLGLARGMGGGLSVAARPGGGCVFTLELPSHAGDDPRPDGLQSQESTP